MYIVWSCRMPSGSNLRDILYGQSLIRTEISKISVSRLANKNIVIKQQKKICSITCGFATHIFWNFPPPPLPCCCFDKLLFLTVLEYFQLLSGIKCLHSLSPSHSFSQPGCNQNRKYKYDLLSQRCKNTREECTVKNCVFLFQQSLK